MKYLVLCITLLSIYIVLLLTPVGWAKSPKSHIDYIHSKPPPAALITMTGCGEISYVVGKYDKNNVWRFVSTMDKDVVAEIITDEIVDSFVLQHELQIPKALCKGDV